MKENKRKESDRKQSIKPVADEKRNSLLQNDRSNSLTNSTNRYNPLDNRIHHNGTNNIEASDTMCYNSECCRGNKKYYICGVVTVILLAITAVSITIGYFVYNDKEPLSKDCFQVCQPKNFSDGIRERLAIKQWIPEDRSAVGTDGSHCPLGIIGRNGTEKTYTLFPYPTEEPKYDSSEVGEELMLSPLILAGRFKEIEYLSKVNSTALGTDVLSYSGFITIQNLWKSHLFFWFFPAQPDSNEYEIEELPIVVWLQGGPGSSSLFGLLKENGPFLVDVKILPDKEPFLKPNEFGWNKAAHVLYVDSPVGTGFSYSNTPRAFHSNDENVSIDLASLIFQFLKVFPTYIGRENISSPPKVFLFGESYGGTVVTDLARYITSVENYTQVLDLVGIGIGNGFISPKYQATMYADFLGSLGLIDYKKKQLFLAIEAELRKTLQKGELLKSYIWWQQELRQITEALGIASFYNWVFENPDITERNFWQFVQQAHVRKAIHIGQRPFSDGELVVHSLGHQIMSDQLASLAKVLNRGVNVLVYHGLMDMLLPAAGMGKALENIPWIHQTTWNKTDKHSYWTTNETTKFSELMGYKQSYKELTFVTVRNAGHMVPKNQPKWSLQILKDFVQTTCY